MCDCKSDVERRLLERFKANAPEATAHEVKLTGYAFFFGDSVTLKGVMPMKCTAVYPMKKGGCKQKTEQSSMVFNYCPFCGVKYESGKDDPEETQP